MFSFIVAMTSKGGIGKNNDLPWYLPKDFKHFTDISTNTNEKDLIENSFTSFVPTTINNKLFNGKVKENEIKNKINACIMGRKTYDSIPKKFKPLKNRINIVLTSSKVPSEPDKNLFYFNSLEEIINFCESLRETNEFNINLNEAFVIGGSNVFNNFCKDYSDRVKAIYLTLLHTDIECDCFWEIPETFETITVSKTETQVIKNKKTEEVYEVNKIESINEDQKLNESIIYDFRVLVNKNLLQKFNIKDLIIYNALTSHSNHEEFQYLNIIHDIITTGNEKSDRTGVGTISKFGITMRYDCSTTFPLLTTKDTYWKGIVEELLWFIKGSTNVKPLQDKKVRIWDGNSTRKYLDSIGLTDREEGDLGPVYGFQWRHSGAEYKTMHEDYTGKGIDQLAEVITSIKNNPDSRRIIICAWNPKDLSKMALPPCHVLCQFYVYNKIVSLQMYQRSCDMGLGVPFNIASYALLLRMICHVTQTSPGEFIHVLGDAHVYKNHIDPLKIQLERIPFAFPILKINPEIKDINDFKYSDFTLIGYKHHAKIKMEMAV